MQPSDLSLSQDAYDAHLLATVMDTTAPPSETPDDARARCAVIVEMFHGFEPNGAMESMIACHCVTLQFVLNAAMRDAGNTNLDPVMLTKIRASAMAISKTLHLWVSKYERIHARNEARATEALKLAGQQTAATEPEPPRETPPLAADRPSTEVPRDPPVRQPGADPSSLPDHFVEDMVRSMLMSATAIPDATPRDPASAGPILPGGSPTAARADHTRPDRPAVA